MMDNTKENRKKEAEEIEKREKEFVTKLVSGYSFGHKNFFLIFYFADLS
jgi:hypothetical protein